MKTTMWQKKYYLKNISIQSRIQFLLLSTGLLYVKLKKEWISFFEKKTLFSLGVCIRNISLSNLEACKALKNAIFINKTIKESFCYFSI